jgi:hypothetical protein
MAQGADISAEQNPHSEATAEAEEELRKAEIDMMIGTDIALSAAEAAGYATKRAKAARAKAAAAAQPPQA